MQKLLKKLSTSRAKSNQANAWLLMPLLMCLVTLGACTTREVKTDADARLVERLQDPALEGKKWFDVYVQSLKRKELIRGMNCDRDVLAKRPIHPECEKSDP